MELAAFTGQPSQDSSAAVTLTTNVMHSGCVLNPRDWGPVATTHTQPARTPSCVYIMYNAAAPKAGRHVLQGGMLSLCAAPPQCDMLPTVAATQWRQYPADG